MADTDTSPGDWRIPVRPLAATPEWWAARRRRDLISAIVYGVAGVVLFVVWFFIQGTTRDNMDTVALAAGIMGIVIAIYRGVGVPSDTRGAAAAKAMGHAFFGWRKRDGAVYFAYLSGFSGIGPGQRDRVERRVVRVERGPRGNVYRVTVRDDSGDEADVPFAVGAWVDPPVEDIEQRLETEGLLERESEGA